MVSLQTDAQDKAPLPSPVGTNACPLCRHAHVWVPRMAWGAHAGHTLPCLVAAPGDQVLGQVVGRLPGRRAPGGC